MGITKFLLLGIVSISFALGSVEGRADNAATPPSRWSLDQWLKQRDHNRLADQWLALHSSSDKEFFVGADGTSTASRDPAAPTAPDRIDSAARVHLGAYASIVGLEGAYESWPTSKATDAEGSFHVRILGTSVRSTHLDAHYVLAYRTENGESLRQQSPGGRLTILLLRTFGISGSYDVGLPTQSSAGQTWTGSRIESEVFIDFDAVRVFGRYTKQSDEIRHVDSTTEKRSREGLGAGLKFFF